MVLYDTQDAIQGLEIPGWVLFIVAVPMALSLVVTVTTLLLLPAPYTNSLYLNLVGQMASNTKEGDSQAVAAPMQIRAT